MPVGVGAYLVVRLEDGFGDVFPLTPGQRYTLGRASTNRVQLKDDLCSREHAEVYFADNRWRLRDLKSLNGSRVNDEPLDADWELSAGDEVLLGRTRMLFVDDLAQLPDVPVPSDAASSDSMIIKKRLGNTRLLTPDTLDSVNDEAVTVDSNVRHTPSRDMARLYRMALTMGSAVSFQELVESVLDGLLESTSADAGAVLSVKEGNELTVLGQKHRDGATQGPVQVSSYVRNEVLRTREAVLAENVARDRLLRNRESLLDMGATSLICAPVNFGEQLLGLIYLYCTGPEHTLDAEDLEFTVAVAKQLGIAIHQTTRQASLTAENRFLRDVLRLESELVGTSPAIKDVENQVSRIAATNATVLVRGESGTGKELVARAIHYSSKRREGPFICLNCAALPETLLESELFGHERGSFTGATEKKIGKFEAADHGTIFLDEIGEMNPGTQAKLLRVLEGHPFERVGGSLPIRTDVRVVAATNQPLEQAIATGNFRRDLFFRLQVVEIRIPPLREHRGDVPLLAEHFLRRFARETGRKVHGFTPQALKKMDEYHWPGNVRELRNVVERAVALGFGPMLDAADIWLSSVDADGTVADGNSRVYRPQSLDEIEKQHILQTLAHTDWNKSQAAAILGIERSTLDRKIKVYELKR
jgi:Nif-specific regulatory protein